MKIRKGKLSDSRELLQLLKSTPEVQLSWEGNTYTKEWVNASLIGKEHDFVLIAEENKKIVGFLIAELWKKKKYSFLSDLFVKPDYRKKKVATMLVNEYEKMCRKAKLNSITLLVLTGNKRMQKFIEKRRYKRGNEFYIFEKRLK